MVCTMSRQVGWTRAAIELLEKLDRTQGAALDRAAAICADAIGGDGLVHLFGTGHSRMFGTNGQRQVMFIERTEGLAEVILRNFHLSPPDAMVVFSARGVTANPIEMAMGGRRRGLPVIAVTSVAESRAATPGHSSGTRLLDHADVVIDLGTPIGDALVTIDGLATPVGPGSSVAGVAVVNELKVRTARLLVARGGMPPVLTSGSVVGNEESARLFDAAYDEHARRLARVLAGREEHA
jgi:uncharacterized phosphosugar-binding protein